MRQFLVILLLLFSSVKINAQELTLASASFMQRKSLDLSVVPMTSYYGSQRSRTPGTIGMIVGGSLIVVGGVIIASTINDNPGEGMGYPIYGFDLCLIGAPIVIISGLVFVINKITHKSVRKFSVYYDKNQEGLAYNF